MFQLAIGEGLLVLIRSLATLFTREALSKFALAATGTFAGGAALDSFDKSSKEICECLDIINQTLTDGLAGRDIETERLNRSLEGLAAKLKEERAVLGSFRQAEENLPEGYLGGRRSEISAAIGNQIRMKERNVTNLEQLQTGLEGQLDARRLERATEPGLRVVPADSTNPLALAPTASGQGLTDFCEAFTAKLDELLAAIEELAARSAVAMEGISAGLGAVEGEALAAGAEMSGEAAGALDEAFSRMEQSAESTFARIAQSGLGASDQLRSAFASLDNAILGSLGKFGSLFSQLLGGGPASFLGSILGLAGGGTAQPGAPILVGERGPEIFLPSGPGRVLNAHNTARAMGGAGAGGQQIVVNQTNSFTTDVRNTVRAEVLNAMPLATNIAARQVSDMLRGIRR